MVNEAAKLDGERQEKMKKFHAGKPPRIHEFHTDPQTEYSSALAVQPAK